MHKHCLIILFTLISMMGFAQKKSATYFFYFESSKDELIGDEKKKFNEFCFELIKDKAQKLIIIGHTDDTDTEEANLLLSENRAKKIKADFIKAGWKEEFISVSAMGESDPADTNSTEKGKAKNRRVEIRVEY